MNRLSRFASGALLASMLALGGCAGEENQLPPVFNAIDKSLQCPTGQVGWDFSTGGNDGDLVVNDISREITVEEATLGASCGAAAGNYTTEFALECDGQAECTRVVKKPSSPQPSCSGGDFRIRYRCGDESPKYEVVLSGDASTQEITLICGLPITIVSATYAANKEPPPKGNLTNVVATHCTGKRRCSLPDPYELNNYSDPWPNQHKTTDIRYICGGESTEHTKTFESGQRIDFYCPVVERHSDFKEQLHFQSASPSNKLGGFYQEQHEKIAKKAFEAIVAACEGKTYCEATLPEADHFWKDSYSRAGALEVTYWCGTEEAPQKRLVWLNKRFGRGDPIRKVSFHCGQAITIVNAGSAAATAVYQERCNGKRVCEMEPPYRRVPDAGTSTYGYGPITYYCGDISIIEHTKTLDANSYDAQDLEIICPAFDDTVFKGIRIKSAIVSHSNGRAASNVILPVTNRCFGRDQCAIKQVDVGGSEVWPTFTGTLTVEYRCGNSPELKTAVNDGILPLTTRLECRPPVTPVSSGEGCINSFAFDSMVKNACIYQPGTCRIPMYRNYQRHECGTLPVTLNYRCGADPTIHTFQGPPQPKPEYPNGLKYVTLECPTLATPYVRKECIPEQCYGKSKRDKDLQCVPDATKQAASSMVGIIAKEWAPGPTPGTSSQWGGAVTTVFKEDVPYQIFAAPYYFTDNRRPVPPSTGVTLWAFDEFRPKPGKSGPTQYGFRCIVQESNIGASVPGRLSYIGGKGAVLPPTCFRQEGVDDGKTSWYDAARRHGVPESRFREDYQRHQSWMIGSFDASGKNTVRYVPGQPLKAVNPIGFYFDASRQWIDTLGFYAQTMDLGRVVKVTFEESKTIELSAVDAKLSQSELFIDIMQPALLPGFDIDFTWYQRGDSPLKNPLSGKSLLTANAAQKLSDRNLRATVELARVDSTLSNPWVAVNATQFPTQRLVDGNAMLKTDRLSVALTPALRQRLLATRPAASDGWMANADEETTAFHVRVCMDFDGLSHALGDTALDNKSVTATRDGITYGLGFKQRCSQPLPLVVKRELFVRAAPPVRETEVPGDGASSPRQGDSAASTSNDVGTEASCGRACTVSSDCGSNITCVIPAGKSIGRCDEPFGTQDCRGQSRSNMTSGGQFSISLIQSDSDNTTSQSCSIKKTELSSKMKLLGFAVFDARQGKTDASSPGAWSVKLDLTPNLETIETAIKSMRRGPVKTDAKKVKTKPKGKGFERQGLAMVLSKEFPFTLGPIPFSLEVGFSVGFGFAAGVTLAGDLQSVASQHEPKYPCLKSGTGNCFEASSSKKNFEDANEDCQFKGGRLAEVRTSADLTQVQSAVASVGGSTEPFWLGGQLAYRYTDPRCQDQANKSSACLDGSRTRYFWLTGDVGFADQAGRNNTLLNTSANQAKHGFGASVGALTTQVPHPAGVLYRKDTQNLISATKDQTAYYVCVYDPAGSYVEESQKVEVGVEFSAGIYAALCTPSSKIGFCLSARLNFITAGLGLGATRSRIFVFTPTGRTKSILGNSQIEAGWEVAFLSGAFAAELRFFFYDVSWNIASYGGLLKYEQTLYQSESPYRKLVLP